MTKLLIFLQREELGGGSVLCDDLDHNAIARVDVALLLKKKIQQRSKENELESISLHASHSENA